MLDWGPLNDIKRMERMLDQWLPEVVTEEKQQAELPRSFLEFAPLCRIRSVSKILPFELYDYQKVLYDLIDRYNQIAILKTRQLGVTEFIAALLLHWATLDEAFLGAIASIGQSESSEISLRVQRLPSAITGFEWERSSATQVQPLAGGRLLFRPSTEDAIRSLSSVTALFIDESDFIRNFDLLYSSGAGAQEMAGDNAKTILVTTPSPLGRLGNQWRIMADSNPDWLDIETAIGACREGEIPDGDWAAAMPGLLAWVDDTGFCKVLLHWKAHPKFSQQKNYLKHVQNRRKLTDQALQREFNLGIDQGAYLFDPTAIAECIEGSFERPNERPNSRYLAAIDPNFGGDDNFCLQIWRIGDRHQLVFELLKNRQSVDMAIIEASNALERYKPIRTVIEVNGGGAVVLEQVQKRCRSLNFFSVFTNQNSKIRDTDRLALLIKYKLLSIPKDSVLLKELPNFDPVRRKASAGHDDSVLAAALTFCEMDDLILAPIYPEIAKAKYS